MEEPTAMSQEQAAEQQQLKQEKKKKQKNRGLTSVYRSVSRNHVSFVAIGDRRANILIGICTLIISVTFSIFLNRFTAPTIYLVPGMILILTCTATMILAIISTRPYNAKGFYARIDIPTANPNVLFFEDFYKMKPEDYEAVMNRTLDDRAAIRHALVRDLHSLGVSVARKYKFLRISYDVLMVGVILSVLAFFVAMIWGNN
ncbi:MAG TPA: Pycsar system effector family protein [Adhaeribacter sp.]|nr:Pycsar system effector family protein [Adhaeribacter sp.]